MMTGILLSLILYMWYLFVAPSTAPGILTDHSKWDTMVGLPYSDWTIY
jgi:hypothetical protein